MGRPPPLSRRAGRYGMTKNQQNTSNPYDGDEASRAVASLPGASPCASPSPKPARCWRGTIGMIEVKGTNGLRGYWRMPRKEPSPNFDDDGLLHHGELGKTTTRAMSTLSAAGRIS